jgi:hypothetical protein
MMGPMAPLRQGQAFLTLCLVRLHHRLTARAPRCPDGCPGSHRRWQGRGGNRRQRERVNEINDNLGIGEESAAMLDADVCDHTGCTSPTICPGRPRCKPPFSASSLAPLLRCAALLRHHYSPQPRGGRSSTRTAATTPPQQLVPTNLDAGRRSPPHLPRRPSRTACWRLPPAPLPSSTALPRTIITGRLHSLSTPSRNAHLPIPRLKPRPPQASSPAAPPRTCPACPTPVRRNCRKTEITRANI